jgi:nucleotide-binding universal stress UspA family protein
MKKILVPVELSELSEKALKAAENIAAETGAEIHLLHVMEEVHAGEKENELKQRLDELASDVRAGNVETYLTEGVPYDDVINHSEENGIDLIMLCSDVNMSYHGTYTASNVLRITRLSNVPVMVIPKKSENLKIEKILFVSDFTFEYDYRETVMKVCLRLKDLFADMGPSIELLFIDTQGCDEQRIEKCMVELAKDCGFNNIAYKIHKAATIEGGALEYAEKSGADILSLIGHGSGNYYTQLRTSISEKLLEESSKPVIIFKVGE